jgi:general L-amino acid transport system substrate-binding protein
MKKPLACSRARILQCALVTAATAQKTLQTVQSRGELWCGVNEGLPGFATKGDDGRWRGFDIDYCRALAAAIFMIPIG